MPPTPHTLKIHAPSLKKPLETEGILHNILVYLVDLSPQTIISIIPIVNRNFAKAVQSLSYKHQRTLLKWKIANVESCFTKKNRRQLTEISRIMQQNNTPFIRKRYEKYSSITGIICSLPAGASWGASIAILAAGLPASMAAFTTYTASLLFTCVAIPAMSMVCCSCGIGVCVCLEGRKINQMRSLMKEQNKLKGIDKKNELLDELYRPHLLRFQSERKSEVTELKKGYVTGMVSFFNKLLPPTVAVEDKHPDLSLSSQKSMARPI